MGMSTMSDPTKSASIWDSLYHTVTDTAKETFSKVGSEAGSMAQNWLKRQAQEQVLDPLERDVFRPEYGERVNTQTRPTTGQSPYTNVPEAKPVSLFSLVDASKGVSPTEIAAVIAATIAGFFILKSLIK
jgi:hypothetical protein